MIYKKMFKKSIVVVFVMIFLLSSITVFAKEPKRPNKNPVYTITINTGTEQVCVFEQGVEEPVKVFSCSTGKKGNTYEGTYTTSDYYEWKLMMGNVWSRYAVRFNGSELMHSVPYYKQTKDSLEYKEYNKLGTPASAGCCRLALIDAKWIYDNTIPGTVVTVVNDPDTVYDLSRPNITIDVNNVEKRGWDPTDWDEDSPYNK